MDTPRISASSYSNTAPLIWSFIYGQNHGRVELILDTAPARSAELLHTGRVDAALVPIIASQSIDDIKIISDVCVGARERARSVCIISKEKDLGEIQSISLDTSSRTSAALTKIIFREFIGTEPAWTEAKPEPSAMLAASDAALLIGDPALVISETGLLPDKTPVRIFDLATIWRECTGFGFIFAMWMTRNDTVEIDFRAARDEGLLHIEEIVSNYLPDIQISRDQMRLYLTENIIYQPDEELLCGMDLYLRLAEKHKIIDAPVRLQML